MVSDVMEPMVHEDQLPGHESQLEPKPDWEPRYPGSGRLKDKVALITGADSGIGRAVAALFAREGADVAILYLCEHDDAKKTKEIVEKEGRKAILIAGDVGDKDFCSRAVKRAGASPPSPAASGGTPESSSSGVEPEPAAPLEPPPPPEPASLPFSRVESSEVHATRLAESAPAATHPPTPLPERTVVSTPTRSEARGHRKSNPLARVAP